MEIRNKFRSKTRVRYKVTADCNDNQQAKYFYIELSTSFNDPEVIDHMYFYNYFDSISDEEKKIQRKKFCEGPDRDDPIIGGGCENYPLKK